MYTSVLSWLNGIFHQVYMESLRMLSCSFRTVNWFQTKRMLMSIPVFKNLCGPLYPRFCFTFAGNWETISDAVKASGARSLVIFLTDDASTVCAIRGHSENHNNARAPESPFTMDLLALAMLRVVNRDKHIGECLLGLHQWIDPKTL
jgi:hypothetical protein